MPWIAIAATVENEVICANDDIVLLEQAAEEDFDVIVKIYGVIDSEYSALKNGNYDFKIRFKSLRSTYLEPFEKNDHLQELTEIYQNRIHHLNTIRGRFEHAFNKHKNLLSAQQYIYDQKVKEANLILQGHVISGFVTDYAEELGYSPQLAAKLIIEKHIGQTEYLRKIELLRIRHLKAIKKARTAKEFELATAALDKDMFINMLL